MNVQRATKQKHTPSHAVGIFKPLEVPWVPQQKCYTRYYNTLHNNAALIGRFHYHPTKKQTRNRSMKKDKNLGCYRKQIYKSPLQFKVFAVRCL